MARYNIVVLGAGVSGLTTALLLSRNPDFSITVVAKHMPGDYDIEYASPFAGANFAPVSPAGTKGAEYEAKTWVELKRLALVPEAGVHFQDKHSYNRNKDAASATGKWLKEMMKSKPWFASMMPNFRVLDQSTLPAGVDSGIAYTSVCINTPQYLHYLMGQCYRAGNVAIKRGVVTHVADAARLHHLLARSSESPASTPASAAAVADMVVNCTGLGSASLCGVVDTSLYPIRGHVVLVRDGHDSDQGNEGRMVMCSGTDDGDDETIYVMKRAMGGGTIIGGTYEVGRSDGIPDKAQGERILKRAAALCPWLLPAGVEKGEADDGNGGLDVIRHAVGLRPARTGGIRVEAERVFIESGHDSSEEDGRKGNRRGLWVVHNYGHGGAGYQTSYGSAAEAAQLVESVLNVRERL